MKTKGYSRGWNIFFTICTVLVVAGLIFNYWFINNTDKIIESLVASQSKGKLQLHLKQSKFFYFSKKLELFGADFYSSDTSNTTTTYNFRVEKLELKLKSFWSFLLHRELLIDSIYVKNPDVTVTRLKASQKNSNISIAEETGKIYNSILDALQVLQVKRFAIRSGRFSLINKIGAQPLVTAISNINFHINNLYISTDSTSKLRFLNSDDVVLDVTQQNIVLPDGLHRMSFKKLSVNVGKKEVELDSCWVKAERENSNNAFRIFFDVLKMTNLDFDALYVRSEIKADSVYITNPDIDLSFELKKRGSPNKKLELDTIIRQFTGDLDLNYIGVQNATVNIIANRGDTATTFSSKNDNFTMNNLRISSDSARAVSVGDFAMVLRKYETYSRDSTVRYRFDSIRFNNNTVRLSNFTIQSAGNKNKSRLDYKVPLFELTGLSWEELLFDRYLSAQKALLVNPTIEYSIAAPVKKYKDASLFKLLSGLNESISLQQIEIKNGNVTISLPRQKKLSLQQVDLLLASNKVLESQSYTGLQQAISKIAFNKAVFTTGNLEAQLNGVRYGRNIIADELLVSNKNKTLQANLKNVSLDDLIWNNVQQSVFIEKLGWQNGTLLLKTGNNKKESGNIKGLLELKNVYGRNTQVTIEAKNTVIHTKLDKLQLAHLSKKGTEALNIKGLLLEGSALQIEAGSAMVKAANYSLADKGPSYFKNIAFTQYGLKDSIDVTAPSLHFVAPLQALMQGNLKLEELTIEQPFINIRTSPALVQKETGKAVVLPLVAINRLSVTQPLLNVHNKDTLGTSITWADNNTTDSWTFYNVHTAPERQSVTVDKAQIKGSRFLISANGRQLGVDSGAIVLQLNNLNATHNSGWQWKGTLERALFKNIMPVTFGNGSSFVMATAGIRHLNLASEKMGIYELLQSNPALELDFTDGGFTTEKNIFNWKRLLYRQARQSLTLDSFYYSPALSRDSFIAQAPGQTDYMQLQTQNIDIDGIDFTALQKDSAFKAHTIAINNPTLNIYRDKRKPIISGNIKPLPTVILQQLTTDLSIDTISLNNAHIAYTEKNSKSGQEGLLTITRVKAQMFPVQSRGKEDSLTVRAEGFLMDTVWLSLRLKEAYADTLGTFTMQMRGRPADLTLLNPALMPMVSVKILSGQLDTVTMRAIAHDYFALGEMKLYYRNLKVKFLNKGSETKKGLLSSFITLAANKFILKKNNTNRTGIVYFLRNRDRSFFNFLIKTTLSGLASSVGAKKNKKYYRQYKQQQKLYSLPVVAID